MIVYHFDFGNTIQYKICIAPCCRGFRGAGEQNGTRRQLFSVLFPFPHFPSLAIKVKYRLGAYLPSLGREPVSE